MKKELPEIVVQNQGGLRPLRLASLVAADPPAARAQDSAPSILQELCQVFDASSPLKLNFADYTGVSWDVPTIRLADSSRWHRCEFCLFAKNHHQHGDRGWRDCIRNKQAVSRLIIQRRRGLTGMCHLGITDLVEPVIYRGLMVGVFFYGSIVVAETLPKTHQRIEHYCRRVGRDPALYLKQLRDVPRIAAAELETYRQRLFALCATTVSLLEAAGVATSRYSLNLAMCDGPPLLPAALPPLVRRALIDIAAHPDRSGSLKEVAARLGCHPVYLGQRFKKATGRHLNEHLLSVRLDLAQRLLRDTGRSIGDIAFACGFDESHFGRAFKRGTGMTPQQFRRSGGAGIRAQSWPRKNKLPGEAAHPGE